MANLYEIEKSIMDCIDLETGEVIEEEALKNLEVEKSTKIENVALWIKNLRADVKAYSEEEKVFKEKKHIAKNKMESLEKYLVDFLAGEKFKTDRVTISYIKSEAVEVKDVEELAEDFIRLSKEANKKAIKEALKQGEEVKGAHLVENQNMQIR